MPESKIEVPKPPKKLGRPPRPRSAFESGEERRKDETACVYFGVERLHKVKREAEAAGLSVSAFVCGVLDYGLTLPPALANRLLGLATARGIDPAELLARIVRDALKSV